MIRLLVLALSLVISVAASADAGLDLVVLLDCSTSMMRRPREELLLLRMTASLLARNAAANRVEHQLAVIRFGSSPTVDLPFTSVRELGRRLDTLGCGDRGETDVLAALIAAERLIRAQPASPDRRQAILLYSDDKPYVRGRDMAAYRADVSRYLARSRITTEVLQADARALPAAHRMITRLAGTQTAESAPSKDDQTTDTLVVPPYLDIIVFDIFRASPGVNVDVFPPGSATPIRPGANGVESVILGDVLATLVVPRPPPGEWIIRKSRVDARVRILSQQFFPRGTLVRPDQNESLRRCDRVPLGYRVLDGSGRAFEELRDYALALEVTLARPNGTTTTIVMERDPSLGVCGFRSAQEIECDIAGRYWTDVRITTQLNGQRMDVFRDRWSGFSVAPHDDCRVPPAVTQMSVQAPAPSVEGIAFLIVAAIAAIAGSLSFRNTKS